MIIGCWESRRPRQSIRHSAKHCNSQLHAVLDGESRLRPFTPPADQGDYSCPICVAQDGWRLSRGFRRRNTCCNPQLHSSPRYVKISVKQARRFWGGPGGAGLVRI